MKQESHVLRDEQTYTTSKREWTFIWKQPVFEYQGTRLAQVRKTIMVTLERGVEFFPSRFIREGFAQGRFTGWSKSDLTVEDLQATMVKEAADRKTGVVRYQDRPRPQTQIELESELKDAYGTIREQKGHLADLEEQLEKMRKQLETGKDSGSKKADKGNPGNPSG